MNPVVTCKILRGLPLELTNDKPRSRHGGTWHVFRQPTVGATIRGSSNQGLTMKVWIDQDLCTGDGLCEEIAPDVFVLLDDGLAYVREGDKVKRGQKTFCLIVSLLQIGRNWLG